MLLRWVSLLVWAVVARSAVFWGFKLFSTGPGLPPQTLAAAPSSGLRGDLTRLLGAEAVPVAAATDTPAPLADARFSLLGVVSPRSPGAAREGVALIAVDGQPARAYRVGAVIEGSHVLKSVSARGVTLGLRDGPDLMSLELPAVPVAATGTLPSAAIPGALPANVGMPAPAPALPVPGRRPPPLGVTMPQPQPPGDAAPMRPPALVPLPGNGQNTAETN
jgi:general secretion pathway protein C